MKQRILFIALACAGFLAAQDPPSRTGRISYLSGTVSFAPAGVSDWAAAQINRPLSMGDQLYADSGRAEVQIPGGAFRLGDQTAFEFLNLDDRTAQVRLSQGTLDVRIRRLDGTVEVDTPNVAFTVSRPGEYRLDVNTQNNQTLVTVRDGAGELLAGGGSAALTMNQQAVVTGQGQAAQYKINAAPGYDSFDRWAMSRNQGADRYAASRYVSPGTVGYEDLGAYGTWRSNAQYGDMWVPNGVASGWAPYSDGEWVWMDPWGWTWVDDEPWGFAPFHYGRWAYTDGYWGWCPGPYAVSPVYAPALVAWVGFGAGFGVSLSAGPAVGWFALGPRDVYIPGFTASAAFVSRVNLGGSSFMQAGYVSSAYQNYTRTRTIPVASYMNRAAPNAVVAVRQQDFGSARGVQHAAIKVPENQIANIRAGDPAPHVAPRTASVLGRTSGNAPHPAAAVMNRPVMSRVRPPAPPPSFAARQADLSRNPGRPIGEGQMHELTRTAPAATPREPMPAPVARQAVHPATPEPTPGARTPQPAPNRASEPQRARVEALHPANRPAPAPPTQHAHVTEPRQPAVHQPAPVQPHVRTETPRPAPPQARPAPQQPRPAPQQHARVQPPPQQPHFSAPAAHPAPMPHAAPPPPREQPRMQAPPPRQAPTPHMEAPRPAPPERREPEHH